jgi:hypothetical protein
LKCCQPLFGKKVDCPACLGAFDENTSAASSITFATLRGAMLGGAATLSLASVAAAQQQGLLPPGWDVRTQAKRTAAAAESMVPPRWDHTLAPGRVGSQWLGEDIWNALFGRYAHRKASEDHWDGAWRYLPSPEEAEDNTTAGSIQRSAARLSVTQPPNADEMCDFGRSLPPDMITLVLTGPSRTERVKAASDTLCLPNLEIVNGVHYSSEDDSTQR